VEQIIATFQELSEKKLITQVLTFQKFKASRAEITNYYYKNQRNHSAKAL
jgi:peptide-methionine (S)-S-oxide reductase